MPIGTAVGLGLATVLGKFLFKRFIGNTTKRFDAAGAVEKASDGVWEAIGGATGEGFATGLTDFVKDKIKDAAAERKAAREFEDLGERIVDRLKKDLESQYANIPEDRWDKVLDWVNRALAGNITASFVVQNRVDSARLFSALRAVPLNVPGPATDEERTLFETALREVSRHIAAAASKLPKFDAENARASLELMVSLRSDLDQVLDDVQFIREQVDRAQGPGARDEFAVPRVPPPDSRSPRGARAGGAG
ncbi:MAG TPA: hypothetical protein VH092_23620, partial [Urbifossiella sp.]|nr:hypothetical protein [Urbifossiella sp.]